MLAKKGTYGVIRKTQRAPQYIFKYSCDVHSSTVIKLSCALLSSIRTLLPHVGKVNAFCV